MNKRVALGLVGGLLLSVGLVIGVAAAPSLQSLVMGGHVSAAAEVTTPTPSAGAYCQLYIDTVSKDLGVSQSQLQSANKDALQAVINKMYADGKLTQTQKVQAESALAQYAGDPCAALQAIAKQKGAGMVGGASAKALSGVRTALLSAVAGAMKMSSSDLQSQLSAGKTVAQVISAQGASKSAVSAAYLKVDAGPACLGGQEWRDDTIAVFDGLQRACSRRSRAATIRCSISAAGSAARMARCRQRA